MKRELYVVIVGRVLQAITAMVVLRIMTGILNSLEVGKFTLIMSIIALFALVFVNPIGMYINRKLHDWHKRFLVWQALKLLFIYLLAITLLATVFITLKNKFISPNTEITTNWLLFLVCGSLIINTMNQTIIPSLNMLGKRAASITYALVTIWSGLIASLLLTKWNANAELWISGQIIGLLIGTILAFPTLHKVLLENYQVSTKEKFSINKNNLVNIFLFSMPISLAVGLNWVQFQSYRLIISGFLSLEFLGTFFAGYAVSLGIMGAFEATAIQYFYPIYYKKITNAKDKEKAQAWNEYASVLFPLTLLTALYVAIMSTQITHLLVSSMYWSSSIFVTYGALAEMGRILGNAYGMVAHSTLNTKSLIFPQLLGAIASIIFVPVLIHILPEQGVGIGLIISSIVYVGSMHIAMRRQLSIRIDTRSMYYILFFGIVMVCILCVTKLINSNLILDILFLIISGIIYLTASYYIVRRLSNNDKTSF